MTIEWKAMGQQRTITERDMLRQLRTAGSPWKPLVKLTIEPWAQRLPTNGQPDFRVGLQWGRQQYEFAAEAKGRSAPSIFERAVNQAKQWADATGLPPMVIIPYLDDNRLDRLAEEETSGLDLSGNGIIIVPGKLLLRRSGNCNQYPESQPTRYAYRGATSLIPRVFLCRPRYESVSEVQSEIESRGGEVALSTVSKALARLADDVIIDRSGEIIALLQPEELLDKLAASYQEPKRLQTVSIKPGLSLPEIFQRANRNERAPRLVLSGGSSQDRYAAGLRADELVAYCNDLAEVRKGIGSEWKESERFSDLTIVETDDRTVFFDARTEPSGVAIASPVQSYLELATGDKRDRDMARSIRDRILRNLK